MRTRQEIPAFFYKEGSYEGILKSGIEVKVVVHIQFVGSRSFCNAIDDCTGLCSPNRVDGHPVFAPQSKVPQRSL